MKSTSDFENVLGEMKRWEVAMASSRHGFGHSFWIRREQQGLPSIPQINPLTVAKSSSRRHRKYITNAHPGLLIDTGNPHLLHSMSSAGQSLASTQPMQHLSQRFYLQQPQQALAPGSRPQRRTSNLAVPGVLGQGVYKISKVKSNPIGQFRVRGLPSSTTREAAPTYFTQPRIARQPSGLTLSTANFDHGSPVEPLQPRPRISFSKFSKHYMAGLTDATAIWNEHMRRGKEESDLVSDLKEKIRIWMRHARVCHQDLQEVNLATRRRMRGQPVGTGMLRRLAKPGIGSRFPPRVPFISGGPAIRSTPQPVAIPPSSAETFTLGAPSPVFSSRSADISSHSDPALLPNSPFSLPKCHPSLTASTQSSPHPTITMGERIFSGEFP
ncbi:hypothetical protein QBC45DRAFT_426986 [Copromyces sp. CBS 386.78]|nr:hypothetical protein QBC45DRAFT_426986 [Copromyces sp. CBS 386.78]